MVNPVIAIVDPMGPGDALVGELRRQGASVVKVSSTEIAPRVGRTVIMDDAFVFVIDDSDALVTTSHLRKLGVTDIVAGSELGVERASTLKRILSGESQTAPFSAYRKDSMYAALCARGVPILDWTISRSADEAVSWSASRYPIIVKPVDSSASDGVFLCRDATELRNRISRLIGKENLLGRRNDDLIVQKFADGIQYEVNILSCKQQHIITDIWRSRRKNGASGQPQFQVATLMDPDLPDVNECASYALDCVKALQLGDGPALVEIILTPDGPRFIEANARHDGHTNFELLRECTGQNVLSLCAGIYLKLKDLNGKPRVPSRLLSGAKIVGRKVHRGGEVQINTGWFSSFCSTFYSARIHSYPELFENGTGISSEVLFYLAASDRRQLEADAALILNAPEAALFI